jgi:glycine/D-amino acid oxidase-like deaminating enzyme
VNESDLKNTDIVVVGAGITGLLAARGFARLGISVTVIEQDNNLSSGATTRNEGWLHHGTYHAVSISDRTVAMSVAKRRCSRNTDA